MRFPARLPFALRRIACYLCSALVLWTCACRSSDKPEQTRGQPTDRNLILITLDTTRADRIGCYGHAAARTPTIDRLAEGGLRFDQAYSPVPLTLPSHASLLTGRYPAELGVRVNGDAALPATVPTLAEIAGRNGLRTGAFVSAFVLDSVFGLSRGFDAYDDRLGAASGPDPEHEERRGDFTCSAALRWLDEAPDKPFFLWVHLFDPHHPYEPPAEYAPAGSDPYDGEIAFVDAQIARLVDWIDKHGQREKTLFVIVGDHGEDLGDHGELQHGLFTYGATLRVPLIISQPGHIPAGEVVASDAQLVDVLPTVMGLFNWPGGDDLPGRSFASDAARRARDARPCYGESRYPLTSFGWAPLTTLLTPEWRFIRGPRPELYDRQQDPAERTNVIAQHGDVARQLDETLARIEAEMAPLGSSKAELDSRARQRLAALGYIDSAADASRTGGVDISKLSDPKDRLPAMLEYMKIKTLLNAGRWGEALPRLESLARATPESDAVYQDLGRANLELGRYAQAEQAYRTSLRNAPSNVERLCGLGDSFLYRGQLDRAIEPYRLAEEIQPDNDTLLSRLGNLAAQQGRMKEATAYFERAVKAAPESPNALCNLANLRLAQSRPRDAATLLVKAIQVDPSCRQAHMGLWQAVKMKGATRNDAISRLREAIKLRPDDAWLLSRLAWCLATAPSPSEDELNLALSSATSAAEKAPKLIDAHEALAAVYAAAGAFDRAQQSQQTALQLATASNDAARVQRSRQLAQAYDARQRVLD